MRPVLAAILALPLLAGCVNTLQARYDALAPLIGTSEAQLVQQLGVPSRSIDVDGKRYLAYRSQRVDVIPGSAWGPGYGPGFGWGAYGGGFPPQVIDSVCETTFEIVDGKIQSFSLRGNAC